MKRYILVLPLLLACLMTAGATPEDDYVQIFNLLQEAEGLNNSEPSQAMAKYVQAQTALKRLQSDNPNWSPQMVNFRLSYVAEKIEALSAKVPLPVAPTTPGPGPSSTSTKPGPVTAPAPPDWENQIRVLGEQLRQMRAEKGELEAKLKEALALQPGQSDPRELAKAEERFKALQKENDLLKATLESEKSKPAPPPDTKALDQAQQALVEANRQLAEEKALASRLGSERDALQSRLKSLDGQSDGAVALRAENEMLKKRLAALSSAPPAANQAEASARQLAEAQTRLAALESDKELLRVQNAALENRVKQLASMPAPGTPLSAPAPVQDSSQIKKLERERDALQKKLEAANKALRGKKAKPAVAHVQQLETELATARAKLDVLEARSVPYTSEELALFKAPETKLAEPDAAAARKGNKSLPAGSSKLAAAAQSYFSARQFDRAEASYLQVLHQDEKSVPALANLAAIQVEAKHFDDAEKNIKQAIALDPEDAYSHYVLGILRFKQARYDEALDALSRAAKLDPQNAQVQNCLGLTLSEKGQRGPAEAALRKAIELQPRYGEAHFNLAIVYSAAQPPALELARWHYQRALAAGYPPNADLEKKLDQKP